MTWTSRVCSETTTTTTKDDDDDWWNAWVSPETIEKEREVEESQKMARMARQDLQTELDLWRTKLYGGGGDHPLDNNYSDKERVQQRRENMVRSAVTTAKLAERSSVRRRRKNQNQQCRKKFKQQPQQQHQQDFCLPDYSSDIDISKKNQESILDDSDSDSDDDNRPSKPVGKAFRTDGKSNNPKPASQLLDGYRFEPPRNIVTNQQEQQHHHHHLIPSFRLRHRAMEYGKSSMRPEPILNCHNLWEN